MARLKTLLAGTAAAAALVLGSAGSAAAYPPAGSGVLDIQADVGDPSEGALVLVSITDNFCAVPGSWTLTLLPDTPLSSGDTPDGNFFADGTLPALPAGTYTVQFVCSPVATDGLSALVVTGEQTLTGTFTVDADGNFSRISDSLGTVPAGGGGGGGGATLPDTGSDSTSTTLQMGALVVAAGLGMLGLAAIRRRSTTGA